MDINPPKKEELRAIVQAHLGDEKTDLLEELLTSFVTRRSKGALLATDQLLNAFFLVTRGTSITAEERTLLENILLRELAPR